ncbi:hypothetical protein [Corynebacterium stationis]|uniref:Uncharacterized protein n=1 Tax=Corynebacterium stationis TaxID=1705 RepID=A0AB36CKM9_9CORY|nr:hypothetical protein [Corynebacterium stationis]NME89373.1 hypothetical protein [Corynebacterium stationis]
MSSKNILDAHLGAQIPRGGRAYVGNSDQPFIYVLGIKLRPTRGQSNP